MTRLFKIKQRSRKELRLEALLPRIENGEIHLTGGIRYYLSSFNTMERICTTTYLIV